LAFYEDIANVYRHLGKFQDAQLLEELEFENRNEGLKYIHYWVDKKMLEGFREVLIAEDKNWSITVEHLHFDHIHLLHPSLFSKNKIEELEIAIGFQLPIAYKNFISNYHNAELKSGKIGFPIDGTSYEKLNRFFWNTSSNFQLIETSENASLIIANNTKEEPISINENDEIFLHRKNDKILLAQSFEAFLQSFFDYQFTPSTIALKAELGDIEFFKKYIQENFIDNKTEDGKTAIQFAIQKNNIPLVKLLLKNGASLDEIPGGNIPKDAEEMVDLLLENGFDPHLLN